MLPAPRQKRRIAPRQKRRNCQRRLNLSRCTIPNFCLGDLIRTYSPAATGFKWPQRQRHVNALISPEFQGMLYLKKSHECVQRVYTCQHQMCNFLSRLLTQHLAAHKLVQVQLTGVQHTAHANSETCTSMLAIFACIHASMCVHPLNYPTPNSIQINSLKADAYLFLLRFLCQLH